MFNMNRCQNEKKKFHYAVPLKARDALFRVRTSPSCLYKECVKDEKIFYKDLTLLYSSVQKYEYYPVGHSVIYMGDECDDLPLKSMCSLVKCKVLSPRGLLYTILPCRINGKLLFTLYRKCAELNMQEYVHENVDDQCLSEMWCTHKLHGGIKQGYKVLKVYEIYHFEKKMKIFEQFVNMFLKLKQEASGFLSSCYNEDGHVS